jgi:DNA polymerase-1
MTADERDPYRTKVKSVTFGKMYGKATYSLAKEWGVPVRDVDVIDRLIWGRYSVFEAWCQQQINSARKTGVVWTIWNGKRAQFRPVYKIADQDDGIRGHAERQSVNTPIQGSAAYHATASVWPIVEHILEDGVDAFLIDVVHDSIISEVHESIETEYLEFVRKVMKSHGSGGVPVEVDAARGKSWGEMTKVKLAA